MAEQPLLSVIVPTVGRPSLARTVRSLLRQGEWLPYEVLLVGDTHGETWAEQLPWAAELARTDPHLSYAEHDGGLHAWGHPQRNHGATLARGRYLSWLGDDDVYLPGAFRAIARAIRAHEDDPLEESGRVFLFRWIAPWKQVLWHEKGVLAQDWIDAECIVCPNVPSKLGHWNEGRYQGDFDMIRQTVEQWGGVERVVWQPEVIAQAQPAEDWTLPGGSPAPSDAGGAARAHGVPA
jgi:hypothetical protein